MTDDELKLWIEKRKPEVVKKIEINTIPFLHIYFAKERDILDISEPIHRGIQNKIEAISRYNRRIEGAVNYGERDT